MGLYARYVLPRLIEAAMKNKDAERLRAAWIPRARGAVLEVGIGSGLNLPFYSTEVTKIYGVEPSAELLRMARARAATTYHRVEFLMQSAEQPLPIEDRSIDTVVITWALCSIPDVALTFKAVKRVLRHDGRLIFLEHGRAPEPAVAVWQDRLTPFWKRMGGGCHLNRPVESMITGAGFEIDELKTGYLPGPRPMTWTYQGLAHPHTERRS